MGTELLSCWKEYRHLFPQIPSQSRFNRRRRNLMKAINLIRLIILRSLDLSQDSHCLIDSLPIPAIQSPANCTDLEAGFELLSAHTDKEVLGDKGYISAAVAEELWEKNRVVLRTIPRSNQKEQVSPAFKHLHNAIRQLIETVNGQLSGQFAIEKNYAHTFWGLCTRLYSKLTAHTLCIHINRLLGNPEFLKIKALAFPN